MRLLLLCTGFTPEPSGAAPLNAELAHGLRARGHDVTVATTFPHFPEWEKAADYRGRHLVTEDHDGVRVLRSDAYFPAHPTPVKRIAYDTLVSASIAANAARSGRPDVIMAVCTPLQLGLVGAALARRWKVPFVFHVQDLVPESAVELDMLTRPSAIALADRMADAVYRRADLVSVIGPTFATALEARGVEPDRIAYLPNWVDTTWLVPADRDNDFRRRHVGDDGFLVGYVGNMGFKQRMTNVVDAAALLRHRESIRFSLVGSGSDMPAVTARAGELDLDNVVFGSVVPRSELPGILAASDVLVVNQAADVLDMVVPSKLLTYAAAGRPVILAGHPRSAGALFVTESGGGIVVEPDNPRALADAIEALRADPDRCHAMGAAARDHVVRHHDAAGVLSRAEDLLGAMVDRRPASAASSR